MAVCQKWKEVHISTLRKAAAKKVAKFRKPLTKMTRIELYNILNIPDTKYDELPTPSLRRIIWQQVSNKSKKNWDDLASKKKPELVGLATATRYTKQQEQLDINKLNAELSTMITSELDTANKSMGDSNTRNDHLARAKVLMDARDALFGG